jgi:lipoprotein-anchoring transpeptidase ErfK/SrfK
MNKQKTYIVIITGIIFILVFQLVQLKKAKRILPMNKIFENADSKTKIKLETGQALNLESQTDSSAKMRLEEQETSQKLFHKARMIRSGFYILINKTKYQLTVYHDGKIQKTYPIAIGKNTGDKKKVGDLRTPEGHFYINYIKDSSSWTHDFKDGLGEIKGAYGPWFISLYTGTDATFSKNRWTGIAIHGTHDRTSIGKNASEGCIRLYNENLLELYKMISDIPKIPVDIIVSDE